MYKPLEVRATTRRQAKNIANGLAKILSLGGKVHKGIVLDRVDYDLYTILILKEGEEEDDGETEIIR